MLHGVEHCTSAAAAGAGARAAAARSRRALRRLAVLAVAGVLGLSGAAARADALDTLRAFVRDVKSGRADFSQVVTSPDGSRQRRSSGSFEFERPNRFRFEYRQPFEQLIVADGRKVWIYDADLNQVSVRRLTQALGATPAALLAGASLDREFELAAMPSQDGVDWVRATPRQSDTAFQSLRIGFRGQELAAVEILDAFGQRSLLQFSHYQANVALPAARFEFTPPPGADLIEQ